MYRFRGIIKRETQGRAAIISHDVALATSTRRASALD